MQILRQTNLEALEKAKKIGAEAVLNLLDEKGLVGRGGAGFPTAKKWRIAKEQDVDERFIICNADEGEPGTFKDKFIIKTNAETMIEGILIGCHVIGVKRAFIYLRGEYEYLRPRLEGQIKDVVERSGMDVEIEIVRGAGAYICGEETAIIQSIMGYRGHAMYKPPYPPVEGLWGKPTVVNNVETFANAAQAVLYDDWNPMLRLFSLSGDINNPGIYELPLEVKMSSLIDIARPKNKLKAISFGCFGGIMPVNAKMEITPDAISKENCHHGAFSIIMIDDTNNIVDICHSIAKFYTYESCGKCTPCREGTIRVLNLIRKIRNGNVKREDIKTLKELAEHIQATSLCGLGQTAGNHVLTGLKHFSRDFTNYGKKV